MSLTPRPPGGDDQLALEHDGLLTQALLAAASQALMGITSKVLSRSDLTACRVRRWGYFTVPPNPLPKPK